MHALAGRPGSNDFPNTYPYAAPEAFRDIVTGCAGAFCAGPGYDLVTGIGTPRGLRGLRAPGRGGGGHGRPWSWLWPQGRGASVTAG